jgi:hypothetical protein
VVHLTEKREGPEQPYGVVDRGAMRTSENPQNANFAMKPSEKSHERANLLAIRRLIAT